MNNDIKYLETKTEKFPYVYTLNIMEALQNEYGSLNAWGNLIEPQDGSEPNIKALLFFVKESINEAIDIQNEDSETQRDFVSEKKVGRIISEVGMKKVNELVKDIIIQATKGNDNNIDDEKNV